MTQYQIGDIVALTPEANQLEVIEEVGGDGFLSVKIGREELYVTPEMITLISRPETLEQKLARIEAENAIMRKGLERFVGAKPDGVSRVSAIILADADAVAGRLAT